ncbi:putative short-chain dehydrogenase/reductase [Coniochaeta sp. 2T2.1]|nr:putative short-chain dehydrogenase/reductase [Coniochaeta sp. 2T2.1]
MAKKTVLITGCSEGSLGYAMAQIFSERGFHVFATVRTLAKAGALTKDNNINVLILDITSKDSIVDCAQIVDKKTGGALDVLVNNAAYSQWFPLLDVDIDEAKRDFDTNFWSMLIMIQTFTPMLIRAKGTICNHGSIAGCFPMLWDGIYGSSKAAVKHMSEVLRYELEPLGVHVICALIGIVDTPMWDKQEQLALPANSIYKPVQTLIDHVRAAGEGAKPTGRDTATPEATGRAIIDHIQAGRSAVVWVGGMARRLKFLINWLPVRVVFKMMNKGRGAYVLGRAFGGNTT